MLPWQRFLLAVETTTFVNSTSRRIYNIHKWKWHNSNEWWWLCDCIVSNSADKSREHSWLTLYRLHTRHSALFHSSPVSLSGITCARSPVRDASSPEIGLRCWSTPRSVKLWPTVNAETHKSASTQVADWWLPEMGGATSFPVILSGPEHCRQLSRTIWVVSISTLGIGYLAWYAFCCKSWRWA